MKRKIFSGRFICLLLAMTLLSSLLIACKGTPFSKDTSSDREDRQESPDGSYLVAIEDEPDTVDFQCTTIHYTVALNVFNRLVEMKGQPGEEIEIVPSLAESWELSEDGRSYTFHLRKDVTFSNGSALTSSDVLYTFTRLLTHPESCNQDIVDDIYGASRLMAGETDRLLGFRILDDYDFVITLEKPFGAFLSCIGMPAASILDEETTREAGERFGRDPSVTIGTGPFIFESWTAGERMRLKANPDSFEGAPGSAGLDLLFLTEAEEAMQLFEDGGLDILDLDELGESAEYYIHGDIYQNRLYPVSQLGISYIALNASVQPLYDVRVRKALQLALNREALLDSIFSGRGRVEHGIYPYGLAGYNPDLPEIPYDPAGAVSLLKEAGYPKGFDMDVYVKASATQWDLTLMKAVISMWKKVGIQARIRVVPEETFMTLRTTGKLSCYTAAWIADYDDPDNFIYTFFGSPEKSTYRSLCYPDRKVMDRVAKAGQIIDDGKRMEEYRNLEKKIVQEDAAWIPLFSRERYYVVSDRLGHFQTAWNGSVKNVYKYMTIDDGGR